MYEKPVLDLSPTQISSLATFILSELSSSVEDWCRRKGTPWLFLFSKARQFCSGFLQSGKLKLGGMVTPAPNLQTGPWRVFFRSSKSLVFSIKLAVSLVAQKSYVMAHEASKMEMEIFVQMERQFLLYRRCPFVFRPVKPKIIVENCLMKSVTALSQALNCSRDSSLGCWVMSTN